MKLDELYKLRTHFTVIGLTGRTGSGCSEIAELFSSSFEELSNSGLRNSEEFRDHIFRNKYEICKHYLNHPGNWTPYFIIKYVDVLLFFIVYNYGIEREKYKLLLGNFYKETRSEDNSDFIDSIIDKLLILIKAINENINEIKELGEIAEIKTIDNLKILGTFFFSEQFKEFKKQFFKILESNEGYYRTRIFLHLISCNIRSKGNPLGEGERDIKNIFTIAKLINRIIKAKKVINENQPTKIIIDSLRNSLEIMFFKERYSAFYMVATKDEISNYRNRISKRLIDYFPDDSKRAEIVNKIIDLDETEYKTKDFSKGDFSSPDVENCIQKSDYHIFNLQKEAIESFAAKYFDNNTCRFLTREEQIMKLLTLIQQPGLISPSSAERAMQIAHTAKLNSGCISRRVGAVVTDDNYYVKSIGWNDVAKGHTPCNLRSVTDFFSSEGLENNPHYSPFEKGMASETSSYKYKDSNPSNFKDALIEYFQTFYNSNKNDLMGKNCSFCFKTVHNHYEGEANQVHTRSLHAEENAMLQITKLGGMGAEGGILFTTASPCELCAKKAYQLGIKKIFFIDPYPGISVDQIIKGGNIENQPKLVPFYGAIGNAYHELYDSFMSYKDEISMTLEIQQKHKISKEINNVLSNINDPAIKHFIENTNLNDEEVIQIIKKSILHYEKEKKE